MLRELPEEWSKIRKVCCKRVFRRMAYHKLEYRKRVYRNLVFRRMAYHTKACRMKKGFHSHFPMEYHMMAKDNSTQVMDKYNFLLECSR